jgi:sugar phosphate isomerase/epimerase
MDKCLICDGGEPAKAVAICRKYNLGIEIQSFYDPSLVERDKGAASSHLDILQDIHPRALHGCFCDLAAGSFDPSIREVTQRRFDQSYYTAKLMEASHLILHHGYVPHTSIPDNWLHRCADFWKEFLMGKNSDIVFHLENMLEWDPELLSDVIDAINSPIVDVNLDIGHVHCNAKTSFDIWIRRLNKRIGYIHVHDNFGIEDDHLALGEGNIPLKEVLIQLTELAPKALWAIESDISKMEESISWLKSNGFRQRVEWG